MRCEVIVKVGDIGRTSRTTVSYSDACFDVDITAPFDDFKDRVEDQVTRALRGYGHKVDRVDKSIYLRPSLTSPQRDFVQVTAQNFAERVVVAQSSHSRRKKANGPFICEFFVFVAKSEAAYGSGIRRATASRISEAAAAVDKYLQSHPEDRVGEIARTHWVLTQARQSEITNVAVPDTATFRQMRHIDAMREEGAVEADTTSGFASVTVRLNWSSDLSLSINVAELRRVLGLPPHSLLADGIFRSFVPPTAPAEDIEDVDHQSDLDEM
ncbi:hypothetical protein PINS_up013068 [Pythium insidiosum]|nr:hypothetical protein PINS_up013068 [Pythium insidiosum]